MQISFLVLRQLTMFYLMIFMGYLLIKTKLLKAEDSKILSVMVIYLVIPCVIVNAFQITLTKAVLQGILFSFLTAILVHLFFMIFVWAGGKVWNLTGIEKATIMYSNAGNMIIPIVSAVLGKEWVLYSSAYIVIQLIFMWTHGSMVLDEGGKFQIGKILKNVNVIAIVIGVLLFFTGTSLPTVVTDTMGSVGNLLAPVGMFITGMMIAGMNVREVLRNKKVYFVCGLRLIFTPLLILAAFYLTGLSGYVENGSFLLLITFLAVISPSSSTIIQMAQVYGKDAEYAGVLNFCSTIVCIITMPVLLIAYSRLFHI